MSDQPSERRKYERKLRKDDDAVFNISMAAAFFDLSATSFRQKEEKGYWVEKNGEPIIIKRTPGGERRFSLNDLSRIAHSLRRLNKMTDRQLRIITLRIDAFKEPVKKHRNRYRKGTIGGKPIPQEKKRFEF